MRTKYILIVLLSIFFINNQASAQINITNVEGEKIILMPDGTWKYADQNKQATASKEVKAKQKAGQVKVNKKKLTKAEKKKLKAARDAAKRRKNIQAKLAKQEKAKQKAAEKKAKKLAKKANKNKPKKKLTKAEKKKLAAEKKAAAKKAKAEKKKLAAEKKAAAKKAKAAKKLAKANKKKGKKNQNPPLADLNTNKSVKSKKSKKGKKSKKVKMPSKKQQSKLVRQQFKPFKMPFIVIPDQDCSYSMNEVDIFTKKKKVAVKNQFFFGYTHPKLEEFMRGEDYLTCYGFVQEVASIKTLNLKYIIDSPTAQDDYGSILEGSRILINLLDGSTVTLVSADNDGGKVDRTKKQTIYSTYFILDKKSLKKFRKSEISQVRMVWSKGFEDYEVYEVDFLINQLNCLDKVRD